VTLFFWLVERLEWDGFGYDVHVIMCYEIDAFLIF
jgi:hypothetical protein